MDPIPRSRYASPSTNVIWLLPKLHYRWHDERWAQFEDRFGRCEARLFHSLAVLCAGEVALAAAHERLHRARRSGSSP